MAVFEIRTYTIRPGKLHDYLKLYHAEGFEIHCRFLGPSVGWFYTEIGALNQVMMMWRYENHADREARRERLYADPDWLAFIPKTGAYIEKMENAIVRPTFFSPMQ
ncbi:NIPSNAP family protein [Rhabdaerophilum sp. SD176]|uniref:NIPSNAP family protein n=1 Tax=Rhabdaerophilum sp. SD176 TaxID=2983548 RepID=UPI0024DF3CAA|nr:NIPSNAP family protein [Rhabdaerophilum sp. SD176]